MGHTKFFPDAGFGTLKKKFRITKVDCLSDIATVVSQSATMNHPQLVGDQSGNFIVPTYEYGENSLESNKIIFPLQVFLQRAGNSVRL